MQISKARFPEFGQHVSIISRGAHYGDGRWLELKVGNRQALQELIGQCVENQVGVVIGKRRELPLSIDKERLIAFIDISEINRVVEHIPEDQVITVETGMRLKDLDLYLKEHNQFFPAAFGREDATVLDVIASGDGGVLEHGFGGPRDLVLGLEVLTANGSAIKCGGKVVKNVTGYDLTKLFVGSRNSLGIPCLAHLRLFARPAESAALLLTTRKMPELLEQANQLLSLGLPVSCMEILDARLLSRLIHLHDPDDKCGLMNSAIFGGEVYYAFILQVAGPQGAVDETLPQLKALRFGQALVRMPLSFEEHILPAVSDVGAIGHLNPIDISVATRDLLVLVRNWWQRNGHLPVQIRLGTNRMRLFSDSPAATRKVLDSLSKKSAELSEPPVVSCSNSDHDYQVVRFDAAAAERDQMQNRSPAAIARQLKERFDPSGCMNPLAAMFQV
ncbi:MAG TPA: FAD-binding oxidoreductase [Chroococcales cyanobacterium]